MTVKYSSSDFKNGLKILIDNEPYSIISHDFVNPGKGQAFSRTKVRNLLNQRVLERTFKVGDRVLAADIEEQHFQFLYTEGEQWHFMNTDTFDQIDILHETVGTASRWLIEDQTVSILFWNGQPIAVTPENFVVLTVSETEPGVRGDTVSNATKVAKLETGTEIRVPLFVNVGDKVKIDTRDASYISRA